MSAEKMCLYIEQTFYGIEISKTKFVKNYQNLRWPSKNFYPLKQSRKNKNYEYVSSPA